MDNPQTKAFVKAYRGGLQQRARHLCDAGLRHGDADRQRDQGNRGQAWRQGRAARRLKKANFTSLRGKFDAPRGQGSPIQDFYLVKAAKRPDGKYETEIVQRVFEDYVDRYAPECAMK